MAGVWESMATLAACLEAQIDADGSPKPCFVGVVPGDTILGLLVKDCDDDADDCGMAWVRLASAFPSEDLINQSISPGNCSKPLALQIEIGILRCSTQMDEQGNGPDAQELVEAVEQQYKDMITMKRALVCCTDLPSKEWVLGTYVPSGPSTGFIGGTWSISLGAI